MAGERPPDRILTARLTLRAWRPEDAPLIREAINTSLAHLRPWMPWAAHEPSSMEATTALLEKFRDDFTEGRDFHYGIFTRDERAVLGGTGLHPRIGPGALEIGYWLRETATRCGYATEAVAGLTRVALEELGVSRVEIRCDPRNTASAAVPRRLGYRHVTTLEANTLTPAGQPRDTMVWAQTAAELAGSRRGG
ncbi:acetyltransferase, GNAT family [Sorangium cellulosum So ce56]|uniref:Acetyltransferase, GNAT family n=1 Tax=Sorangium cellulosum (strain So ce56) TaxID=448385 RepID=A9GVI4_SORC5|nr:GNAT family N-acetyltransferase [Sorangium cellulosum]CAN90760.1 acetyltransferase, GNAT family [Sorangium cellulosum So ce56]